MQQKRVVHFKSESVLKLIQIWRSFESDLNQYWLRYESVSESDLNQFWNWFRLEMYNLLVAGYWQLPGNGFTVPGKHFCIIKFYSLGIIFLKKCQSGFCHFGVPGKMHQICWSLARPWALIQNWSISDLRLNLVHTIQRIMVGITHEYEWVKSDSSLNLGHTLQRRLLLYTQQYERFKYD